MRVWPAPISNIQVAVDRLADRAGIKARTGNLKSGGWMDGHIKQISEMGHLPPEKKTTIGWLFRCFEMSPQSFLFALRITGMNGPPRVCFNQLGKH